MRAEVFILLIVHSLTALTFNLTSASFDKFMKENPLVLVHFNAPWCSACKKAVPVLNQIAEESVQEQSALKVASVDLSKESYLNERYEFSKLPTLKLYFFETPITYLGPVESKSIRKWLTEALKNDIAELSSTESLKEALQKPFAVLLCTPLSNKRQIFKFKALQSGNQNIEFLYSQITDFRFMNKTDDNFHLIFIRNFDSGIEWFSQSFEFEFSKMEELLLRYKEPSLLTLNEDNFNRIIREYKSLVVRFTETNSTIDDSGFEHLAKVYGSSVKFCRLSSDDGFGMKFFRFAKIPSADLTSTYLFSTRHRNLEKFKLSGSELNESAFVESLNSYFEGKLVPSLASEETPVQTNNLVKTVVGRTFDSLVRNSDRYFLIMIVGKNCCSCDSERPQFEGIAKEASVDSLIDFGVMDGSKNDVSGLSLTNFPSYYLFGPKIKKSGIRFEGLLTKESIAKFVKTKTGIELFRTERAEPKTDEL